MKVEVKEINETRKQLLVEVSGDEVAREEKNVLGEFTRHADIKGFRKGKAPEHMLRAKFGKNIRKELSQRLSSSAYQQALKDTDLDVVNVLNLEGNEFTAGEDTTVTITVDSKPEIKVPDVSDIELEEVSTEVTDEDVENTLTQLLNERASFEPVERAAEDGDYVKCSYEGKIGDDLVSELVSDRPAFGTQTSTWEEAGAPKEGVPSVEAIVNGLVGMSAGDEKDVDQTFPEDFDVEALQGKTVSYHLSVEEVREKILPDMDEAFFKGLGVDDEEHLRKGIRQNLEQQKKQQAISTHRRQISEALQSRSEFPVPESIHEQETQEVLQELVNINHRQGITEDQLEDNKDQLHAVAQESASNRIKLRYILLQHAKDKEIGVEEKEVQSVIVNEAMRKQVKVEDLVKDLRKDPSIVDGIRQDILVEKALHEILQAIKGDDCCDNPNGVDCCDEQRQENDDDTGENDAEGSDQS